PALSKGRRREAAGGHCECPRRSDFERRIARTCNRRCLVNGHLQSPCGIVEPAIVAAWSSVSPGNCCIPPGACREGRAALRAATAGGAQGTRSWAESTVC